MAELEEIIGKPSVRDDGGTVTQPATGLTAMLMDLKEVLTSFGETGWLKRALQLSKHTKTLRKLDKKIRGQVGAPAERGLRTQGLPPPCPPAKRFLLLPRLSCGCR